MLTKGLAGVFEAMYGCCIKSEHLLPFKDHSRVLMCVRAAVSNSSNDITLSDRAAQTVCFIGFF